MERFTKYHAGVPVILDKGEGRRVAAAKRFAVTVTGLYALLESVIAEQK